MKYKIERNKLSAIELIELSRSVGWGLKRNYQMDKVEQALKDTSLVLSVRLESGEVVASLRAFSDDLFMTFVPDLFVKAEFQKQGFGKALMEELKNIYGHTKIFFGSQPGNEEFFQKLGFKESLQSFAGQFKENPYFLLDIFTLKQ